MSSQQSSTTAHDDSRTTITVKVAVVILATFAFFAYLAVLPPIRQNPQYHHFADTRFLFAIPNAASVVSSLLLLTAGIYGAVACARATYPDRTSAVTLFAGIALTGIGSTLYHLSPSNDRLFWDRLPLALVVMPLLTLALTWYISPSARFILLPAVSVGLAAGIIWHITDLRGAGDLKWWWGTVEVYPILVIALLVVLFRTELRHRRTILLTIGFFALAQVFDTLDGAIFGIGHVISGHTLKHLAGAAAGISFLASEGFAMPRGG